MYKLLHINAIIYQPVIKLTAGQCTWLLEIVEKLCVSVFACVSVCVSTHEAIISDVI